MSKILVCNQKMFLTKDEAINLRDNLSEIDSSGIKLIMCPSFLNFDIFNNYLLGAQDCFYEQKGAYTGEISAYDLSLRGISYSIVGHSDRRRYDTDEIISKKVTACLKNNITPILCIGETLMQKELFKTSSVLKKQLQLALSNINKDDDQEIYIAYEPVWAIGGDKALKKEDIKDVFLFIKKVLEDLNISNYKLLYGGSVTSSVINETIGDYIDGYLVGSACVDIEELKNMIKCIK